MPDFADAPLAENTLNPVHVVLAGSGPSSVEVVLIIKFSLISSVPKFSGSY